MGSSGRRLRVLYVHHCGVPGGASTSLLNLLKYLEDDQVEKHVVVPRGTVSDLFRPYCRKVYELSKSSVANFFPSAEGIDFLWPRSLLGYIRYYPTLKEIRDITAHVKPDLVHFNDLPFVPSAIEVKKMGAPVVMHARTAPGRRQGILDRLQRFWINRYVDQLICISGSVQRGFHDIPKSCVVYNPSIPSRTYTPRKRLAPNEVMNCIFLSNFLAYKGIYETLEAARLLKDNPLIHFYIAGSDIRPEAFYASLHGRVFQKLGLTPHIARWIREFINRYHLTNVTMLGHVDDIDQMLGKMHVNLAPVRLNAPPRSVFEAAVHEIPSILALTDIVEDLVVDKVTGLIIPPRDPHAIADAVLSLRDQEDLRMQLGQAARERLMIQHDPNYCATQILGIYHQVLSDAA